MLVDGESNSVCVCVFREASTPQEASGTAPARLPIGRHQDGIYHPHPLRYYQGGFAAVVIGQHLPSSKTAFSRCGHDFADRLQSGIGSFAWYM